MSPQCRFGFGPRWFLIFVLLLQPALWSSVARAQAIPDNCQSEVQILCDNILFAPPWGYGDSLGDLGLVVTLRDEFGIPIEGIPPSAFEVLGTGIGNLILTDFSELGTEPTDAEGRIILTRRIQGMGSAVDASLVVTVTINTVVYGLDCNVIGTASIVSPDMNADGLVNLFDVAEFGTCMQPGNYCVEADFNGNGEMDLGDQAIFMRYLGGGPFKSEAASWIEFEGASSGLSAKTEENLFLGCLQRDFDEDGDPSTILDSLFVVPGMPLTMKIIARDFAKLSAVEISMILPFGITLFPSNCVTPEPPFAVGATGVQGCGTGELPPTALTIGGNPCLESGPIFVATITFWGQTPRWVYTHEFDLSGKLGDCRARPTVVDACIGTPTPCEVSSLTVGNPNFLTCPGADMDLQDTITLTLRDQDGVGVPGVHESEIEISIFDELGSNEGDRFRLVPLDPESDINGEIRYRFEARESCRWDGCFDLLITARLEACELSARKTVRTLNVVRFEDDPLALDFDEINESDVLAFAGMVSTLDPCGDLLGLYRCPIVHPTYLTMLQNHLGHSCSVTSAPDLPPVRWGALEQNVPNPFNPRTRITVNLGQAARSAVLEVYTLDGRLVSVIWEGPLPEGDSVFHWDGTDAQTRAVSSGVYLARLVTERDHDSIRMVLLR